MTREVSHIDKQKISSKKTCASTVAIIFNLTYVKFGCSLLLFCEWQTIQRKFIQRSFHGLQMQYVEWSKICH